jgi:hypothetical protein
VVGEYLPACGALGVDAPAAAVGCLQRAHHKRGFSPGSVLGGVGSFAGEGVGDNELASIVVLPVVD